jgi:hypothetical protein
MDGHDLKKALMRRHELARHLHPAAVAVAAVDQVCGWMGWDGAAMHREVTDTAAAAGLPLDRAYQEFCRHQLRERLNDAKWEFVANHPHDPASLQVVELARSWQARVREQSPDDERQLEFPADEEAYGEPDRSVAASA